MSGVKGRSGGHNRKTLGQHELAGVIHVIDTGILCRMKVLPASR